MRTFDLHTATGISVIPALPGRTVLCMKWGTKYNADYVNRLYAMVSRQLAPPFRFVCLTDDPSGIREGVECRPIPVLPLPDHVGFGCGWEKLGAFAPELAEPDGTVLFLDLDVVIVGPLDDFFTHPGDFLIIRDWYYPFGIIGNSSIFRFRAGRHPDLLEHFRRMSARIVRRHRNDQEFLTRYMRDRGLLSFWPRRWCRSFKFDCAPAWPMSRWRAPSIPQDSRVLVFHGNPKPPEAMAGQGHPSRRLKPALWIGDYWRE